MIRPKRQKPERPGSARRKSARREFVRPEYGRQIDADLTEPEEPEQGAAFSGADFPEIDPDDEPAEPVITHAIVRERAVRLLVNREHGRNELEQKLLQRELPQDLIVSVLDQLVEEGLQCDARFAESYTRMRVDRGFGANKVRADLQTRRLEQSVIEEAITDNGADWIVVATDALSKKFGSNPAADAKGRAKMQRFLHQRGFSAGEIRSALRTIENTESHV